VPQTIATLPLLKRNLREVQVQPPRHATRDSAPPSASGRIDQPGCFVDGAGTPVVLLHSSLSSKSQWTALAERLAPKFRVIAPDLCGYGDAAPVAAHPAFSLDDEVRLVVACLDGVVAPTARVHVVGHSYGALVALRLAWRMPDRVASLALYEPVAFRLLDDEDAALVETREIAARLGRLLAAGRRHDAARLFVDFWSEAGSYAALPLPVQSSIARRVDKLPLDFQAALGWAPDPAELRAIVAPTLLLAGNRSPAVVQRIHARLVPMLPHGRVGTLDADHMGPVTASARVNRWIEDFVDLAERQATVPPLAASAGDAGLPTAAARGTPA
jgi:pimeloyl-ACP methyl ester carboxylesterase